MQSNQSSNNNSSSASCGKEQGRTLYSNRRKDRKGDFESSQDISNFYLKKTAFLLSDILSCVEKEHSRFKCQAQIESLSKNLYEYKSEVNEFVEKSSMLANQRNFFPPQVFSQPTIVYREYRGGQQEPDKVETIVKKRPAFNQSINNNPSNESFFKLLSDGVLSFGNTMLRKIIGRGED